MGPRFRIIDIKSASTGRFSQKVQVYLYAGLLDEIVREEGIPGSVDLNEGAVWLGDQTEPTPFSFTDLAPLMETFLREDLPHTDSGRRTRLGFLCGREAGRLVRHESRRQAMARVAGHLSVEDLEAGFRSARDPTAARHFQVIWLLARGHTIADVAAVTSFVPRWIEQLLARYNAKGPDALGDLRRRNGSAPSVLRPALLEQ